jgi:hypothetical protein
VLHEDVEAVISGSGVGERLLRVLNDGEANPSSVNARWTSVASYAFELPHPAASISKKVSADVTVAPRIRPCMTAVSANAAPAPFLGSSKEAALLSESGRARCRDPGSASGDDL